MYRLVRCYSTSRYILSLKSTYWYILVCTFWEKYIPVHTSIYHNRYISVYTRTYRYILVHGGSVLVHSIVHSSTYGYMRVHPCSPVLFPLLQHPAGPVLARLKIESCRIAAAERHTSSMKTISLHYSSLPTPRRRPLGGGPGAGLVGGAAADSAGDAAAARLCLWRLLGCPGRR
jgi:hypothetical protein